jgi:hypothetical protein
MKVIEFSHKYTKFPAAFELSMLVGVFPLDLKELSPELREYDTYYHTGHYDLPQTGQYMLLLFIANGGIGWLWPTIRRWTPEKEKYYRGSIGEVLECKISQ